MRRRKRLPSYRLHKPTGQAVVTLNGKDYYLGRHGTQMSKDAYDRLTAEWLASGRQLPAARRSMADPAVPEEIELEPRTRPANRSGGPTINELILAYWQHAEKHYRGTDRRPTQELENMRDALRPLHKLYGSALVTDFGPLALRTIQQSLARSGLCRTTINARINRIRRVFKWAVGVEIVPPSVHQALQAVPGLQKGRTDARE